MCFFFFSSRRRHTRYWRDWSSDVCSSDLFFYDDIWVYLAWVREFLSTDKLALYEPYFGNKTGLSRVMIDGWLLEQAALSRASGVDPIELMLDYLAPALVVVALLAFYALARILFRSEAAALLSGCLLALFYLVNLEPSLLSFGGEFVGRIAEDRKSTRLNSSHANISYAVFCLKKKTNTFNRCYSHMITSALP